MTLRMVATFTLIAGALACNERDAAPTAAGTEPEPPPVEPAPTPAAADDAAPAPTVERLPFDRAAIPDALSVKGEVVGGVRWRDASGDNVVVLSSVMQERDGLRSMYLRADHAVTAGGETTVLRTVRDKEERCDFDLIGGFIDESLAVTDLDDDLVGEVTFAYELTCTSDVSPSTLKLLVLEGGDKYILRGTTRIEMGDEAYGGERTVDPSFEAAPSFRAHAESVWDDIVVRGF